VLGEENYIAVKGEKKIRSFRRVRGYREKKAEKGGDRRTSGAEKERPY